MFVVCFLAFVCVVYLFGCLTVCALVCLILITWIRDSIDTWIYCVILFLLVFWVLIGCVCLFSCCFYLWVVLFADCLFYFVCFTVGFSVNVECWIWRLLLVFALFAT